MLSKLAAVHEGTKNLEGMVSQVTAEGIGASLLDFLTAKIKCSERKTWQREFITAIYRDWEKSIEREMSLACRSQQTGERLSSQLSSLGFAIRGWKTEKGGLQTRTRRLFNGYSTTRMPRRNGGRTSKIGSSRTCSFTGSLGNPAPESQL